jgi:hypothetical protein
MAGRGVGDDAVEIMPKGILASEKWLRAGIGNQDFLVIIAFQFYVIRRVYKIAYLNIYSSNAFFRDPISMRVLRVAELYVSLLVLRVRS